MNPSPSTSLSSAFTARPLTTTGWSGWKEGRGEKEREEGRETEEEEGGGKGGKRGWRVGGGWKKGRRRMEEERWEEDRRRKCGQEGRKERVRSKRTHFAIWDKLYSAKTSWLFQRFLGCIQAGETVIMRGMEDLLHKAA